MKNKPTQMFLAFLKLENLMASNESFSKFLQATKDYNYLCKIEKLIKE